EDEEVDDGGSQAAALGDTRQEASHPLEAHQAGTQLLQPLQQPEAAAPDLPELRLLRRRRDRYAARRVIGLPTMGTPHLGIDAMGGDFGPTVVAEGVALALREMPGRFRVTLVGDEAAIRAALRKHHLGEPECTVVHAPESVDMADKAVQAARKRERTSLGVLTQLHKEGQVDALFSAGNTGAVVATALLGLGRLEGVSRPALAAFFPNGRHGSGTVVLDVGATADVKAAYLVQFAHLG